MDRYYWIAILITLGVLLRFALRKNKTWRTFFEVTPGPPPNILFGNTLYLWGCSTPDFLNLLMEGKSIYGDIYLVYDGPLSCALIVSDYKLLQAIYSSTTIIEKAVQYRYLWNWLGTGLLTSTGKKWKQRRRIITPAFHFSVLQQFVEVFESVGDRLVKKLEKEVDKISVDIYPFTTLCTLDSICEAAMGTSINAQEDSDSEYVRSVKVMCRIVCERTFSAVHPVLYPLTPNYYAEKKALKVLHSFSNGVIDRKLSERMQSNFVSDVDQFGIKKRKAFLDLLLECTIDGTPLSREDLREEVDTFMFEGHDTTASAITFALYSLATNPEIQQKVLEEQIQIFGEGFKDVQVTATKLQHMKYLELVLKETLRIYPSVPFIGRTLPKDIEHDGVVYPKGLQVMLFTYGVHRDPKHFPEPEKFKPERFETDVLDNSYIFAPFSAGPRNCVGQKFAMLEMKSTVAKVVRNFELLPPPEDFELKLAPESILLSKSGVHISLKRR